MRNKRGFTLIEVLVVLLITAIVMAVLISVLGSSFEILRAGESKAKLTANARTLIDYVTGDIETASYIPLSSDRDLNGWPDESPTTNNEGYDLDAVWRVSQLDPNNIPVVQASFFISEAWGDRIMTRHFNSAFGDFLSLNGEGRSVPKIISQGGRDRPAQWISFFRLAQPASAQMPYYGAQECDRDGDGVVDLLNTGLSSGVLQGYPDIVAIGPHKETAVAIQDVWYAFGSDEQYQRIRQIPVASNITRLRYEYFQEVPVYLSRVNGGNLEIAFQDLADGSIDYFQSDSLRASGSDNHVPLIDHWEQRIVDVGYDGGNGNGGLWTDSQTGTSFAPTSYRIQDQYPEGYDDLKRSGTHVNPPTGVGLGVGIPPGGTGWNCSACYNIDSDGDQIDDNLPIDRLAFVTTGISNGQAVEGGIASLRPDMEALHGIDYYLYTQDPAGLGDLGDADGIPDGDGIPDDPVPGWWLPYVRSIRVTVVATPSSVIEQRTTRSGKAGKTGQVCYYRLDSPVPFADANRTMPLYNRKQDYIGAGADLILTKTVPVNFAYRAELVTDANDPQINGWGNQRRVEHNYLLGTAKLFRDPVAYDTQIVADDPTSKLFQKDPTQIP